MTLFTVLLHERDAMNPFFQSFWVRAEHLGEALALVRAAAAEDGLARPLVCTAACATREPPEDAYPLQDGRVWATHERHCYPPEVRHDFALPAGVVLTGHAAFDTDEIRAGYRTRALEGGLSAVDVVADAARLVPDYLEVLRRAGPVRRFGVKVMGHWEGEGGAADVVLWSRRIDSARKVEAHLARDPANGIENGYLAYTACVAEGRTRLDITDHKVLRLVTRGKRMARRLEAIVRDLGYRALSPFRSVEWDCGHYHYRAAGGLGREALIRKLRRRGFVIDDAPATRG